MLYEVITVQSGFNGSVWEFFKLVHAASASDVSVIIEIKCPHRREMRVAARLKKQHNVITSYSIHYTKLYDIR